MKHFSPRSGEGRKAAAEGVKLTNVNRIASKKTAPRMLG